ncbi:serine-type peptidase [Aureococcus anophagefferens]|nr:serine-type peptidase [Aureococcus anophagefferens]
MVARGLLAAALAASCALATDVATFGDLAAVNAAGGRADVSAATIAFDDTLNVTTSLAVAGGGGATLDGNGRTLFRVVAGGRLELARLSITGAVGDAIAVEADGFARRSRVALFGNAGGAPLAVVDGSATVAFSSFYDNVNWAGVGGGAVSFLSAGGGRSLSVANCTFRNNSALDGGALFAATGPDETALGPLANASRDVVRVENASFEGNWAPYRGGSIVVCGLVDFHLAGAVVRDSYASEAGALYVATAPASTRRTSASSTTAAARFSFSRGGGELPIPAQVGGGATLGGFQSRGETPRASAADWVVAGNYRPYFGGGLLVTCAATFEGLVLDGNAADCLRAQRRGRRRRRGPRRRGRLVAAPGCVPATAAITIASGDAEYLSAALVRLGGAGARRLDDAAYAYAYDAYAYEAPYDIPGNKTLEDFVDFFGASTYLFSAGTASQSRRVCLEPGSYAAVLQSDGGYGWAGEVFSVVAGRDAVVEATVPYLGVGITTTFDVAFFGDQAGAALAFVGNGAGGAGGAVAVEGGAAELGDARLSATPRGRRRRARRRRPRRAAAGRVASNAAAADGGGVQVEAYGSVFAEDCVFANNTARGAGSGSRCGRAGGAVVGGAFVGNAAAAGGGVGAVYSDALPLKLTGVRFEANAAAGGGGLGAVASDVRDACAFVGNAAAGDGGALRVDASSTVVIDGGNATAPDVFDTSGDTHVADPTIFDDGIWGPALRGCAAPFALLTVVVDTATATSGTCPSHWDYGGPSCDIVNVDCDVLETDYGFDCGGCGCNQFRFEANRFFEIASSGGFHVVGPETWISGQLVYIQQLCVPPGDYVLSAYDLHLRRGLDGAIIAVRAGGVETALDGADFVNGTVASKPFVVPARAATSLADNTAGAAGGGLYHETAAAPPGFGATRRSGNGAGGYGDDAATPPRSMLPPGEAIVEGGVCVPCPPGTYNTAPGGACVTTACDEDGFECDAPGRSIETLPLEKGYMRQRDDSEKPIACVGLARNELNCPGGVAAGCAAEGHGEGATCSVCAGRYFFDVERATCEKCDNTLSDAAPATVASIVLILVGFALLLYLLVFMASSTKDVKKTGQLGRLRNKLKAKWKIVFVGFNIMASMPAMLPEVTYPRMYGDVLKSIDFLKLDIGASLPLTCLPTSGGGHYQTLLFMTLAPLVVIALVLALSLVRARCAGAAPPNLATSLVSVTVLVTYLVLPAVTTTIFRTLDCVELDDPKTAGAAKFLRAHYPTRCDASGPYGFYFFYAVACVFVWPIGVPLLYFLELYRRRDALNPDVGGDDEEAEARAIAARARGGPERHVRLLLAFISDSDDTLAETINYVVVFMFLGALSAFLQAFDSQLDYFFIAINLMCVVIILALCYSDINREKAALKFALGEARELHKSLSRRFSSSKLGDDLDLGPGDEAAEAPAPDREPPGAAPGATEAVTITELVVDGVALASTDGDQRQCGAPYGAAVLRGLARRGRRVAARPLHPPGPRAAPPRGAWRRGDARAAGLAVGDRFVPVWTNLDERRRLGELGCYGGVDFVVAGVTLDGAARFDVAPGSRIAVRPLYPLVPRLERPWPATLPEAAVPLALAPASYTGLTAASAVGGALAMLGSAALAAALFVSLSVVPTRSMEPGIAPGDVLLVEKTSALLRRPPKAGEVVLFAPPPPLRAIAKIADDRALYVKRVAAVAGDVVAATPTGGVAVNGARLPPAATRATSPTRARRSGRPRPGAARGPRARGEFALRKARSSSSATRGRPSTRLGSLTPAARARPVATVYRRGR